MSLPNDKSEAIASFECDLLLEGGSRQRIVAWVSRPRMEDGVENCPCGVEVLGPERVVIFGEEPMQALCLALKFLHRRLSDELQNRTFLHPGTPDAIDQRFLDAVFSR